MELKHCSRCGEDKAVSAFWKDKTRKDGRQNWCIACRIAWARKYDRSPAGRVTTARYERSELRKAARKRYETSEKGKATRRRYYLRLKASMSTG